MTMDKPARPGSSYAWLLLPAIALIYGAMATFGSSEKTSTAQTFTVDASRRGGPTVTFENAIPDTIPTCSDSGFPNTRPTCFTAGEILNRPGTGTNWLLMVLAIVAGVVGLLGFAQKLPWQPDGTSEQKDPVTTTIAPRETPRDRKPPSTYGLVLLQAPTPMMETPLALIVLAVVVGLALLGGLYWLLKRK